jgi:hypothetical protein
MYMNEITFDSRLVEDGHLYCPEKYLLKDAKYKVTVYLPEKDTEDTEIDRISVLDDSEEYLSPEEINYYMNLKD